MDAEMRARSRAETLDEIWKWTVGAGILLFALAPLSLPILILTIVAVLPLVVPMLAVGLVAGVIALPVLLIRKLRPRARRLRAQRRQPTTVEPATGR